MAQWETLEVLPVVKAYPEASKKYRTTVCVAAVTIPEGRWVRLYPVRFTAYSEEKQFKKYQPFEVRAVRNESDPRPESYRIDEDTIRITGPIVDTKDDWSERKRLLYGARVSSLCELQRLQKVERKSLGMIRVGQVTGFRTVEADEEKFREANDQHEYAISPDLFNEEKLRVEALPFKFQYAFCCTDPTCRGHNCSVLDWEAYALYRRMVGKWGESEAVEKVRQKYVDFICGSDKETYFYMGNMKAHPGSFLVLGAFYPSISNSPTLHEFEDLDPATRTEVPDKPAPPAPDTPLFSDD
jgi:hypothetical protein